MRDLAKEYFFHPKNVGVLADANAVGEVGSIDHGDTLKLMLKIDPATASISEARFQAFGRSATLAAASAITAMVQGKSIEQALQITAADIATFTGGLPRDEMVGAVMAYEALQLAIAAYHGVKGQGGAKPVCTCFNVDAELIERTVRMNRLTTPDEVTGHTKAAGGCLGCFGEIEQVLAGVNAEMAAAGLIEPAQAYRVGAVDARSRTNHPRANGTALRRPRASAASPPKAMAPCPPAAPRRPAAAVPALASGAAKRATPETLARIGMAIADLRPHLQRDGGDCELVDVDGHTIFVKLSGACVGCQMASVTISGVQERLAFKLGQPVRVVPVQ